MLSFRDFHRVDRTTGGADDGLAMIMVILLGTMLVALSVVGLQLAEGSRTLSRHDQDWNGSLSASEGGIDDYIHRLNENANYWVYSASNPAPDGNTAFTGYTSIPGIATSSMYRYGADTTRLALDGTIKLTATGKVRGVKRTVQATLRRRTFIDYLWFTDFETLDPGLYSGTPFTPAQAQTYCAKYYYGGSGIQRDEPNRIDFVGDSDANGAYCSDIQFISQDNVNGPLHSNDAILVCGTPHFNGDTSTSWNTAAPRYRDNCPTSHPVLATNGDPRYLVPLTMPPSNAAVQSETVPLSGGTGGGCLYTGPTKIVLNASGTMTVTSPFSKNTNNGCPTNGTGSLPVNGVIYVQNVPATVSDPNYTNGCPYNVRYSAADPFRTHPLGYPIANDVTSYGCRNGDVFIEGTLKGQLTVAAANNVVVTWNLQYNNIAGSDLLGLVANNDVQIYHPVDNNGNNLNVKTGPNRTFQNPTVQAAVLSVNHSFRVQNWNVGSPLGTINLTGAIAQRFRGAVGTSSGNPPVIQSGYAKGYVYDQRLKYLSPPKFLDPVASAWGVAVWKEQTTPAGL